MRKLQRDLANCLSPCLSPGTRPPSNGNFSAHSMQRAAGNCCCSKLNQHAIKFASKMKRTIYRECSARLGFRMFFTLFYFFSLIFRISHFALQQEIKKSQLNAALFQLDCKLAKCCHIVAHAKMQANWTVLLLLLFFQHLASHIWWPVATLLALPLTELERHLWLTNYIKKY